ncbi:hypothetical protein Tco_0795022 [Tanacetum coccineum]
MKTRTKIKSRNSRNKPGDCFKSVYDGPTYIYPSLPPEIAGLSLSTPFRLCFMHAQKSSSPPLLQASRESSTHGFDDVYSDEELTIRVDDEAITFKVGQTSRYSYNDAVSINRIDVIDVGCEEYAQELLGFSDSSTSGHPTSTLS